MARGISNASVHLANNLAEWRGQLLTRLSTQQAAAKQRLTSEQVVVDSDAKQMYALMRLLCVVHVCACVVHVCAALLFMQAHD